jgi:hypothetical protein
LNSLRAVSISEIFFARKNQKNREKQRDQIEKLCDCHTEGHPDSTVQRNLFLTNQIIRNQFIKESQIATKSTSDKLRLVSSSKKLANSCKKHIPTNQIIRNQFTKKSQIATKSTSDKLRLVSSSKKLATSCKNAIDVSDLCKIPPDHAQPTVIGVRLIFLSYHSHKPQTQLLNAALA